MGDTKHVIGMAHRGASYFAPENTAASFKEAKKTGIDGVETDVHLTEDKVPVIHHNYTVDSTSNGSGYIHEMTYEELSALDFGSYKGKEFAGEKILTLDEFLSLAEEFDVVNIELKAQVVKEKDFVPIVLSCVERSKVKDHVIFSSFDPDLLYQVKKINAEYRVGLLTNPETRKGMMPEMAASFIAMMPEAVPNVDRILDSIPFVEKSQVEVVDSLPFKIDYLHPAYTSVLNHPELVEEMHERSIGVNVWTCDQAEEMKQLVNLGVDGIITNRPDIFIKE